MIFKMAADQRVLNLFKFTTLEYYGCHTIQLIKNFQYSLWPQINFSQLLKEDGKRFLAWRLNL